MKSFSQLQQIMAILLIFILLIELTGCYSTRTISAYEIDPSDLYLIHGTKLSYPVNNITVSDSILSANYDAGSKINRSAIKNQIYLSSDSAFNFNSYLITVPVNNIVKIQQKILDQKETRALKTALIIAGCIGVVTIIATVIVVNSINDTVEGCDDIMFGGENSSTGFCSNW